MNRPDSPRSAAMLVVAAAAILTVTMGARQSIGLFISPINTATGVGIVSISLALAIGQFVWGLSQPIFGALAERFGSVAIIALGGILLAIGTAATPFMASGAGLMVTLGVISAAGAGAGSFSILIGATAGRLPASRRSFASGFINAGGSFGQFLFAPIAQLLISTVGWAGAMFALAAATLTTIPLAIPLRGGGHKAEAKSPGKKDELSLAQQLRVAVRDRNYLLLNLGFFTCGFHIAFLITHLPGEVALCGLPAAVSAASLALIGLFNIAGSLTIGALGSRYRMKYLLALMYASRAAIILVYLASPKTTITFYTFAATLGFTWLATIPPTVGLVGKLFGMRHLATLFGLSILGHQVGGFFGAYMGGLAIAHFGNYQWMWIADAALAAAAALVNLPISEARMPRRLATA